MRAIDAAQKIIPLRRRHKKGIRRLEEQVYPPEMVLGCDLLCDVLNGMSGVVIDDDGDVVAYVLVEESEECTRTLYVADIVRTSRSEVSGSKLLAYVLEGFAKSGYDFIEAECRSTSVKFIEEAGLPVIEREEYYCSQRCETMVLVRAGKS